MLEENKNLKDTTSFSSPSPCPSGRQALQGEGLGVRYTKTNKLITALYMVTDIMEKDEPLRIKLRTLGIDILSDTYSMTRLNLVSEVDQILSFLVLAGTMNIISEMNKNILIREFNEFKNSLNITQNNPAWLEEFMLENPLFDKEGMHKGHTKIGIQKGDTLLKALSDTIPPLLNNSLHPGPLLVKERGNTNDVLKKQRREEILKILKDKPDGISIKDIALSLRGLGEAWGEKTLQRELVSMVKDNILKKTGEKRWSRYCLPK